MGERREDRSKRGEEEPGLGRGNQEREPGGAEKSPEARGRGGRNRKKIELVQGYALRACSMCLCVSSVSPRACACPVARTPPTGLVVFDEAIENNRHNGSSTVLIYYTYMALYTT